MSILFINACVRPESRTLRLAEYLLGKFKNEKAVTLDLQNEHIEPLNLESLRKRDKAIADMDFSDPMFRYAKQFAEADTIVMAAPYWDISFPALIKIYFEAISVCGITFRYTPEGHPQGLCQAKKFYYVTTAGGYIGNFDFGFQYAKIMAQALYGIPEVRCFRAEGLDIQGTDVEAVMEQAEKGIIIDF